MYGNQVFKPTGERTVAQRIYFDRFWVHVPELYFRTEAELALMGRYVNHEKGLDRQLMLNTIRINIPIAGMCQYLDEGAIVQLDNPKQDSVIIYKLLVEHLQNWVWLSAQMNAPDAPIDDLRLMDRFAELLHPIASLYQEMDVRKPMGGMFGRLAELSGGISRTTAPGLQSRPILERPRTAVNTEELPTDSVQPGNVTKPGYSSLAAVVARQTFKNPWTS